MQFLHRERYRRDFLHKLGADLFRDPCAARSGHEDARVVPIDPGLGFHPLQELQRLFRLLGLMPLVVLPQCLIGGSVDYDRLYSRRSNIEPHQKLSLLIMAVMGMPDLLNCGCWFFERCDLNQCWPFMIVHEILKKSESP